MASTPTLILCLLSAANIAFAQPPVLGPDSQRQPGVPQGKITKHALTSAIFPGTLRDYWVYVPAQYKPDKPACVMIFQDGGGYVSEDGGWRVPIVFDNLIQRHQMPVTIGIFINPGVLPALSTDQQPRYNRSFEYDGLGDRYARMLIEEVLPEVEKEFKLSSDPNDRAISGASSGGIAAFTAAWNRPDAFHRVLSFIGSYSALRGGEIYPSLIRKTEPKPLRVYLEDGSNDQNNFAGNWYLSNQEMASALKFAGYDSTFVVGTGGGHDSKHGGAILPDALRWLWRDYPKPIVAPKTGAPGNMITEFLDPASDWELVSSGYKFSEGPAVDRDGNIFFVDAPASRIHKISAAGDVSLFKENTGGASGLMFGPDGRLYACQDDAKRVAAYTMDGQETVIAEGSGIASCNDLAVTARGEVYFTDPRGRRVWFVDSKGAARVVHQGIGFPNGLRLSPDQALLTVDDSTGKWVWSFQVAADGSLTQGEAFCRLEIPDESSVVAADGMTVDNQGFVYVATWLGLQVCDPAGRVVGIIGKPQASPLSNVVFAGPDLQTLYVTAGDKVFRRHIRRKGVLPWTLTKQPPPRP